VSESFIGNYQVFQTREFIHSSLPVAFLRVPGATDLYQFEKGPHPRTLYVKKGGVLFDGLASDSGCVSYEEEDTCVSYEEEDT